MYPHSCVFYTSDLGKGPGDPCAQEEEVGRRDGWGIEAALPEDLGVAPDTHRVLIAIAGSYKVIGSLLLSTRHLPLCNGISLQQAKRPYTKPNYR